MSGDCIFGRRRRDGGSVFEADRGLAAEVVDENRLRRLVVSAAGYPDGFLTLRMRQANRQPPTVSALGRM